MPDTPETLHPALKDAWQDLSAAKIQEANAIDRATRMREEANRTEQSAKSTTYSRSREATETLMNLSAKGTLTPRETLVNALLFRQEAPNPLGPRGEIDSEQTLANFDALLPDTPVLANPFNMDGFRGGIVTGHPVAVEPCFDLDLNVLPDVEISFGIRPITLHQDEAVLIENEERVETKRLKQFAKLIIGTAAIQQYFDDEAAKPRAIAARATISRNLDAIRTQVMIAQRFNMVLDNVIDLTGIARSIHRERINLISSPYRSARTTHR
jgi:hypothetical protein